MKRLMFVNKLNNNKSLSAISGLMHRTAICNNVGHIFFETSQEHFCYLYIEHCYYAMAFLLFTMSMKDITIVHIRIL